MKNKLTILLLILTCIEASCQISSKYTSEKCPYNVNNFDFSINFNSCDAKRINARIYILGIGMESNRDLRVYLNGIKQADGSYRFFFTHKLNRTIKFTAEQLDWELGQLRLGRYNKLLNINRKYGYKWDIDNDLRRKGLL